MAPQVAESLLAVTFPLQEIVRHCAEAFTENAAAMVLRSKSFFMFSLLGAKVGYLGVRGCELNLIIERQNAGSRYSDLCLNFRSNNRLQTFTSTYKRIQVFIVRLD